MIENVTAPYFRDLERRVKLRHEDEATALCKGIVLGLYRAEQRGFELLEYAGMARPNLPAKRLRSGSVGAATFRSRVRLLRSSHPSGIGSLAKGREVKLLTPQQSTR